MPKKITLPEAIQVLRKELSKSKVPGSYYDSWKANLAIAYYDTFQTMFEKIFNRKNYIADDVIIAISNAAALNFLDQLCYPPEGKRKRSINKSKITLYSIFKKQATKAFNMPTSKLLSDGDLLTYLKRTKL